jgi:hypothetical protein
LSVIQPTNATLRQCTINGIPFIAFDGTNLQVNFHVKEFRIFEDICKFYFTGQLVIETMQNSYEGLIGPTIPVTISFEAPRSDGGPTKVYTESFRIYSYDSTPISGGTDARIEHTLQLIGQEFYNDRHNTVMQGFKQIPGTSAAKQIHDQYINVRGSTRVLTSTGLIGSQEVPHQALNVKPVKAIHDILDRVVYASEKTGAPVYFRNKPGYVMSPLKTLIETAAVTESFQHILAPNLLDTMQGYNNVIHMRPLAPPGEAQAQAASAIANLVASKQFLDNKTGNIQTINAASASSYIKGPNAARIKEMLADSSRGGLFGGRNLFHIINDFMQNRSIAKTGPGGYKQAEEAFLTALTYAQKYWVSVPLQTGVNVTCGDRIRVTFPIPNPNAGPNDKEKMKNVTRTFFIPRLIHEIKFTQGKERTVISNKGSTDFYCLLWG